MFKINLTRSATIYSVLIILHLIVGQYFAHNWFLDLGNHFRPYEIVLLSILATFILVKKKFKRVAWLPLSGLLIYFIISSALTTYNSESGSFTNRIQVITYNVLTTNKNHDEVFDWLDSRIRSDRSNIIFLMETNDSWIRSLSRLKKKLPYTIEVPRDDNFGIYFLSDIPLDEVKIEYFDDAHLPAIYGTIFDKKIRIAGGSG